MIDAIGSTMANRLRPLTILIRGNTGKNIITVFFADILNKLIMVVIAVLTIRVLPTGDYAVYTVIAAISGLIASITGDGLNISMVRVFAADPRESDGSLVRNILVMQIAQFLILTLLAIVFSSKLSLFFFGDAVSAKWVVAGAIAGIGLVITQFGQALSRAKEDYKRYNFINNFRVFLLLAAFLALFALGRLNLVSIIYILIALPLIFGLVILRVEGIDKAFVSHISRKTTIGILKKEFYLLAFYYILALFSQVNVLVIAGQKNVGDLAVYGVAQRYYLFLVLFLSSVSTVLLPKLARMCDDRDQLRRFLWKWLKLSSLFIPVIILVIILSPLVLNILNGNKYPGSNILFQVLCVSAFFSLMFSPLTGILVTLKRYKFLAFTSLVQQSILALLSYWAIRHYGMTGLVIVFTIGNIAGHLWSFCRTTTLLRKS